MTQKPVIYVGRITNLSDARYCAGMGVDMLGFVIDPAHEDYVSPIKYQEIVGWVAGPKRVVEIAGGKVTANLVADYAPDLIHITLANTENHPLPDRISVVIEIKFSEISLGKTAIQKLGDRIEYILITDIPPAITSITVGHPVLLSLSPGAMPSQLLQQTGANGFALQGSKELSPGLKDYDDLSRILEELDGN